jgi:hypothetical protein
MVKLSGTGLSRSKDRTTKQIARYESIGLFCKVFLLGQAQRKHLILRGGLLVAVRYKRIKKPRFLVHFLCLPKENEPKERALLRGVSDKSEPLLKS